MEALGVFRDIDSAARASESLIASGVPEDNITSLSHVPLPDGAVVRDRSGRWFHWFALGGGVMGAALGFLLAAGTALLYPLHTGDKPIVSPFPVGIIVYEFTMLFAILGTVLGMFLEMRLPGFMYRVQASEITREGLVGVSALCETRDELKSIKDILIKSGAQTVRTGGVKEEWKE